jgi:hypothetical protein
MSLTIKLSKLCLFALRPGRRLTLQSLKLEREKVKRKQEFAEKLYEQPLGKRKDTNSKMLLEKYSISLTYEI